MDMIIVGIDKASWETRLFISNKIIYIFLRWIFYDLWPYEHDGKRRRRKEQEFINLILSNTYIIHTFRRKSNRVLKNILFNGRIIKRSL